MWAIIQAGAMLQRTDPPEITTDPVELMLFGPKVDLSKLHPDAVEIYGPLFKELEDMDRQLDSLMMENYKPHE